MLTRPAVHGSRSWSFTTPKAQPPTSESGFAYKCPTNDKLDKTGTAKVLRMARKLAKENSSDNSVRSFAEH